MSKPLKVLGIASWYPSREHETLGNFVKRHAEAIALKHSIVVISAFESAYSDVEIVDGGEDKPSEVIVYYKKRFPVLSHRKAIRHAYNIAVDYFGNFDLAHVHVVYPSGLLAPKLNIPYVVTEHFSGYHNPPGFKWGALRKHWTQRVLRKASVVLPVSDHLGKAILNFAGSTRIEKVSNVVDTDLFQYSATPLPEPFTFLHISTLEERSKNISGILEAFAILEKEGIDYRLRIGGDGDINELRHKLDRHQLDWNKLEILEERPLAGIASLMSNAHAFVMFSNFENQPCVILEALCSGLPVISTNVGGIPEELNDTNGMLLDPGKPAELAEKIKVFMANYDRYQPAEIAKSASQLYSYQEISQRLDKIYASVLNEGS